MRKLSINQYKTAKLFLKQGLSTKEVAPKVGLGQSTVRQIRRSRTWSDYQERFVVAKRSARKEQEAEKEIAEPDTAMEIVVVKLPHRKPNIKVAIFVLALIGLGFFIAIALVTMWRYYAA